MVFGVWVTMPGFPAMVKGGGSSYSSGSRSTTIQTVELTGPQAMPEVVI
jgi:hypothetical protein